VQVLKGVFRSGRFAALPRQVLVVVQFTASLVLITGTIIVYDQIQHARNRPIGYERENLLTVGLNDPNYKNNLDLLKTELLRSTVVKEIATSSGPITSIQNVTNGYEWQGKDPNLDAEFAICNVTTNFGKTVSWEFVSGRDFSDKLKTDSVESIIINEAAQKYMGFKDPVGKELTDVNEFGQKKWSKKIIGVVKDMVMESPYQPVKPTLFYFHSQANRVMHIKLNSTKNTAFALGKIESVFTELVPSAIFNYKFVDEEYAHKFSQEERIGKLSGLFSILAICISCLGLFGLASFVAEQRTREIGIRKVVGASVFSLWKMLTKDFVVLVVISGFIAIPVSYYLLSEWLVNFEYRTEISWWVFLATGFGSLAITLFTVSFQAIKAALMNPVKSLRSA
jgi:putative ABC transport system permease protein